MSYDRTRNAGLRLLEAQRAAGTNLCIGLDPHYAPESGFGEEVYNTFAAPNFPSCREAVHALADLGFVAGVPASGERFEKYFRFLAGVQSYSFRVINAGWDAGIRVFKPQAAFYEQLGGFGLFILQYICRQIHMLGKMSGEPYFIVLDAKRGDISDTQRPYYNAYLSGPDDEVVPGLGGQYDFDTMTIHLEMGEDVLVPGLPWFQKGKGAIVVTRSSNPSGTTFQDGILLAADTILQLSLEQEPHRLAEADIDAIRTALSREPTVAEVMMHFTEKFCREQGLVAGGVSSLFSVIGSTVKEDGTFRQLRPTGIALVPGFGAQGGSFANAMPLLWQDGEWAGQGAIFSSSRGHMYSWVKKYGGSGDPRNLDSDLRRAINAFRVAERKAYLEAGIRYPYA